MAWKMDESGTGIAADGKGNPLWVNEAGEEKPVDYSSMVKGLQSASQQSAKYENELRQLQQRYAPLAEVEDLSAWLQEREEALEMARNAPDAAKDFEEQFQERVKPIKDGYTAKLNAAQDAVAKEKSAYEELLNRYNLEKVHNSFSQSSWVRENLASPSMAAKLFMHRFELRDGQVVGTHENGDIIFGDDGNPAPFDVALARIIDADPDKLLLYRGSDKSGSGARTGTPHQATKAQLNDAKAKAKFISEHGLEAYKNLPAK